jgi:hypothetical protein
MNLALAGLAGLLMGVLSYTSMTQSEALLTGENLVSSQPMPEHDWQASSRPIAYNDLTEWRDNSGRMQAQRLLRYASGGYPASAFRQATDGQAEQACAEYLSHTVSRDAKAPFPYELWRGECQHSAGEAVILHLYITGRAQGYYLMRAWQTKPGSLTLRALSCVIPSLPARHAMAFDQID